MQNVSLKNRTAIITGGARGIGEAIARDFHERGCRVLITDILDDTGVKLVNSLGAGAAFHKHDVRNENEWDGAFTTCEEIFGKADILINNAGIEVTSFISQCDLEDFRKLLDVNVLGVFLGMKHGLNRMSKAQGGNGGAILNLSSMSALLFQPGFGPYGATKSAVKHLTKVGAVEAGALGTGVRVNCLYPGIIETNMQAQLGADLIAMGVFPDAEAIGQYVLEKTPLARTGTPEDVAHAAAYLCSDLAAFITGVGLPVDGGMAIG